MATANNYEFNLIGLHGRECQSVSAVTLSCHLAPEISAVDMEIKWFYGTDCVCLYKNRQVTVDRGYEGRVSLFTNELESGNVSLQIRDCTWSDLGYYLCQVTNGLTTEECTVRVSIPPAMLPWSGVKEVYEVLVSQEDRKWTDEERKKMEKSVLLTELARLKKCLKENESLLMERNEQLMEKEKHIQEKDKCLTEVAETLHMKEKILKETDKLFRETKDKLEETTKETQIQLMEKETQLENLSKLLSEKEILLENTFKEVQSSKKHMEMLSKQLGDKSGQLQEMMIILEQQKTELSKKDKQLEEKGRFLSEKDTQLMKRHKHFKVTDTLLEEKNKQLQKRTNPLFSVPTKKRNIPPKLSAGTLDSTVKLLRRDSMQKLPPTMSAESSNTDSPCPAPVTQLRLVLLGRTGCGKTAVGNTILGREKRSSAGGSTLRQQSESTQGEVVGKQVTVVNTPDWFCPELSLKELRQDVRLCVQLSAPGPHAFLLVIPLKQSTGEERGMLEKMEEMFGERCWRNTIIIFPVTDEVERKNIEELVQSRHQEVQRLVQKCGKRFNCLNIKECGDGSQISELLEKIEKMMEGSREKFYSSEVYLETESHIREIQEELREIQERETRQKLERSVNGILIKFEESISKFQVQVTHHKEQITKLESELEEVRDDKRKEELEKELEREIQKMNDVHLEIERLREKTEKEKKEMEERHRQEMEEIMKMYEGIPSMAAERNLIKIVLPRLQDKLWEIMTAKQKDFNSRMDEKQRELETLKERISGGIRVLLGDA